MTRIIAVSLLAAWVAFIPEGGFASSSQEPATHWPHSKERGSYQAKIADTGKLLWEVQWETTVTRQKGQRSVVEIRERGEGTPWKSKEPLVWEKKMLFEEGAAQTKFAAAESPVLMQSVVGSRWTEDGKPISDMDFVVNPDLRHISYRDSETGRKPQSVVIPWSPQSIPDEMLFHWVRTLPFQEALGKDKPSAECTLVVSTRRQVRLKAQVQGTEVVTTPAGTFSCYKVTLTPQLPGPLKALAPRMAVWCRTEAPNYWVRYQGPVGGPGSPEAVIELVKFEQVT